MAVGPEALERENADLRRRRAQLQGDVTDPGAETVRLRRELERLTGPRRSSRPDPLAGGR